MQTFRFDLHNLLLGIDGYRSASLLCGNAFASGKTFHRVFKFLLAERPHDLYIVVVRLKRFRRAVRIFFPDPDRAVARGQAAVFYCGSRVLGGGVIDNVEATGVV